MKPNHFQEEEEISDVDLHLSPYLSSDSSFPSSSSSKSVGFSSEGSDIEGDVYEARNADAAEREPLLGTLSPTSSAQPLFLKKDQERTLEKASSDTKLRARARRRRRSFKKQKEKKRHSLFESALSSTGSLLSESDYGFHKNEVAPNFSLPCRHARGEHFVLYDILFQGEIRRRLYAKHAALFAEHDNIAKLYEPDLQTQTQPGVSPSITSQGNVKQRALLITYVTASPGTELFAQLLCSLRDIAYVFGKLQCDILTIASHLTEEEAHQATETYRLPFPLLGDQEIQVAQNFGIASVLYDFHHQLHPTEEFGNFSDRAFSPSPQIHVSEHGSAVFILVDGQGKMKKRMECNDVFHVDEVLLQAYDEIQKVFKPEKVKTRRRKKMKPEESLGLRWYAKWRVFRRIPWKLIVHILLAIALSTQILVYVALDTPYRVALRSSVQRLFIPDDFSPGRHGYSSFVYRTVNTVARVVDQVYTFFHINEISPDRFSQSPTEYDNGPLTITTVLLADGDAVYDGVPDSTDELRTNKSTVVMTHWDPNALPDYLQSNFSSQALHDVFEVLRQLKIKFTLYSQDYRADAPVFYTIPIELLYNFEEDAGRGELTMSLQVNVDRATTFDNGAGVRLLFEKRVLWIDPLIIILALTSLFLVIKAIFHSMRLGRITYNYGLTLADLRRRTIQQRLEEARGGFSGPKEGNLHAFTSNASFPSGMSSDVSQTHPERTFLSHPIPSEGGMGTMETHAYGSLNSGMAHQLANYESDSDAEMDPLMNERKHGSSDMPGEEVAMFDLYAEGVDPDLLESRASHYRDSTGSSRLGRDQAPHMFSSTPPALVITPCVTETAARAAAVAAAAETGTTVALDEIRESIDIENTLFRSSRAFSSSSYSPQSNLDEEEDKKTLADTRSNAQKEEESLSTNTLSASWEPMELEIENTSSNLSKKRGNSMDDALLRHRSRSLGGSGSRKNPDRAPSPRSETRVAAAEAALHAANASELPDRWEDLSILYKLKYVDAWFPLSIVAALFSIVSSILSMLIKFGLVSETTEGQVLNGLACAFVWFNLLRYFESFPSYHFLLVAIWKGLPNVGRLLVAALPIFLGYTFFGMVVFGSYSNEFNSFDHAFSALFSTIQGDDMYARYIVIDKHVPLLTRLYEYSFTCIGAYAVVNIFIAIIQDSYSKSAKLMKKRAAARQELVKKLLSDNRLLDLNVSEPAVSAAVIASTDAFEKTTPTNLNLTKDISSHERSALKKSTPKTNRPSWEFRRARSHSMPAIVFGRNRQRSRSSQTRPVQVELQSLVGTSSSGQKDSKSSSQTDRLRMIQTQLAEIKKSVQKLKKS